MEQAEIIDTFGTYHLFARLIDHILMMTVILTFLTELSSLLIFVINADSIFSMLDNI